MHTYNPDSQEAEIRRSIQIRDQPGLHREFKSRVGYIEKAFLTSPQCKKETVRAGVIAK